MVRRTARRLLKRSVRVHEVDTRCLNKLLYGVEELLVERRRKASDALALSCPQRLLSLV